MTTVQTMEVSRALAELKRLDDKITRAISSSTFVGVQVGLNDKAQVHNAKGTTVDQLKATIQGAYDSVTELFNQRSKIKAAIVKSNAVTLVKVGAVEMTVAEAIELKRSIENKRNLLNIMKKQSASAQQVIAQLDATLEAAIDSNLKTLYGSDKTKQDKDAYDFVAKPQRDTKAPSLIDPIKLVDKIALVEEEVSLVDTELDFTLSISNAKTLIEV
jgi:ribosomal protein L17